MGAKRAKQTKSEITVLRDSLKGQIEKALTNVARPASKGRAA